MCVCVSEGGIVEGTKLNHIDEFLGKLENVTRASQGREGAGHSVCVCAI